MRLTRVSQVLITSLFIIFSSPLLADYTVNMPKGVTEISHGIYRLHMIIFWICAIVGILVFSTMFYAIIWHRKSRGVTAANFHENTTIEVIWTVIPFAILVFMAIPATKLLIKMDNTKIDSDLSIKITGHQWRWEYEYLGENLKFISNSTTPQLQIRNRDIKNKYYLLEVDNPLVVPVGKKIRLLTTAGDVIHSWWVPELGIKKDAIPGFINEAWTKIDIPGTYRGQCAELCGVNHGYMPIVVEAKSNDEYLAWLKAKKAELNPIPNTPIQENADTENGNTGLYPTTPTNSTENIQNHNQENVKTELNPAKQENEVRKKTTEPVNSNAQTPKNPPGTAHE